MSTTRLMVLGVVKMRQPVHGYEVRRELESWQAQEWASIAPGSIYHALRRLAEEGLLAEVATEQVAGRPARTTYRMTAQGDEEYARLLRQHWWVYRQPIDPFMAGFAFTTDLRRREAAAALRNRARLLRAEVDTHRFALASDWMKQTKPVHVAWMFELTVSRLEVEIAWCERVAGRIEVGGEVEDGPLPWPESAIGDSVARDRNTTRDNQV